MRKRIIKSITHIIRCISVATITRIPNAVCASGSLSGLLAGARCPEQDVKLLRVLAPALRNCGRGRAAEARAAATLAADAEAEAKAEVKADADAEALSMPVLALREQAAVSGSRG